ncbi:hypothetical protein QEZ54_17495 [Catellatospora sp. KI3]|uniref:hypothetical protein n=1 Tax=Catellatospora sp. KI3 TaxID=3041620 RepID=UPI002482DDD9|nr:hypothetical protein [Catellatospora sp. KI3]MDI1462773.1 hypothetical protein [Catellatospora sp. KI3]
MSAPSPTENPVGRKVKWPAVGAFIVGAVGVIAALAQTWSIFFPTSPASDDPTSPAAAASAAPAPGTSQNTPGAASTAGSVPVSGVYLTDLPVETGSGLLLARLPDGLPPLDHPIAVHCPSNQTNDKMVEIRFERPGSAKTLVGALRAYGDPLPVNQAVELTVFRDPPDRKVGGGDEGMTPPVQWREQDGEPAQLAAKVADAYYVRLRFKCQKPDSVVVLDGARLTP